MMTTAQLVIAAFALSSTLVSAFPIYTFDNHSPLLPRTDNTTALNSLQSCLSNSGGTQLAYQSSSDYSSLSSSYNPIFAYKPLVITVPSNEAQVASIVKCVSQQQGQYKLSPRSGGHSYESYSLGGQDGSVVVDLQSLSSVVVDQNANTAKVGAGVRLGTLAQKIWDQGQYALPHGTCPMVGVSGHALGGGFGFTTRAWGFLLDRIVSMRIVDRDGTIRVVSKHENNDLWWGLRGGGANNFGVVTEFGFSLEKAPTQILNFAYSYKTNQDCAKALVALQSMILATDPQQQLEANFGGELLLAGASAGDFDGNSCQLSGQHVNSSRSNHDALMSRFHTTAAISPAETSVKSFSSWIESLEDIMGSLDVTGKVGQDHEQFYAKSLVQPAIATYDYNSALALVNKLDGYAGLQGTGNSISFDFLGPLSYPSATVDANDSAFNAHQSGFVSQFYSYGFPGNDNPQAQEKVHSAFDDLVNTAKASKQDVDWGAYVNYIDARQVDWPNAYYASALARLKQLKSKWDPQVIFDFPQSLAHA
ncbi:related to Reticuline oxidase precursor [Melanopsichium pennsylvanicum]|uniref:Related to Reticuline oxidase n=2 Tax=Melanopsichium pennsylvanicum TaxID=63383 RepID=A0AAJ4XNA4_9BASI|nr:related to Reticuline oxidase precursor [Melanopsichium pennsylvanicum 4]SNX85390.1 related to Reticuline oxidase precursor [Melanopsichium pennsylvanicum]